MKQEKANITVDLNRCPQNHPCPSVNICPTGALYQNGFDAPAADMEQCIGCGKCVRYCPMGAISLG
ncbi:4Fe-4S binding protein [Christensenella massiliensis]|uniref:4Fe-4S binding protein n=1 Tax=Christensenella massiliensis TaxID=1805714 RepID=A0AAU8ABH1_9FIRM